MSTMKRWVSFAAYDMKLIMARDLSGRGNHTLVLAGPGLRKPENLEALAKLGFRQDPNFQSRVYWTRDIQNFRLSDFFPYFPNATAEFLPVEEVVPSAKLPRQPSPNPEAKPDENPTKSASDQPGERNESDRAAAAGSAGGSRDDGGTAGPGVLGADGARDDVPDESPADGSTPHAGETDPVPGVAAEPPERGSPQAGEGLAPEQPSGPEGASSQQEPVAQPSQDLRAGDTAQRGSLEPRSPRARAARSVGSNTSLEQETALAVGGAEVARKSSPRKVSTSTIDEVSAAYAGGMIDDASAADPLENALAAEQPAAAPIVFADDEDASPAASPFENTLASLGLDQHAIRYLVSQMAHADFALTDLFDHGSQADVRASAALAKRVLSAGHLAGGLEGLGFVLSPAAVDLDLVDGGVAFERGGDRVIARLAGRSIDFYATFADESQEHLIASDHLEAGVDEFSAEIRTGLDELAALRAASASADNEEREDVRVAGDAPQPSPIGEPEQSLASEQSGAPGTAQNSPQEPVVVTAAAEPATTSKVPAEPAPLDLADDDQPAHAIDRIWRGATMQHMLDAMDMQLNGETAFSVLEGVERGEPVYEMGLRSLVSFAGWGRYGDKLKVDSRKPFENKAGQKIATSLQMTGKEFQRTYLENRLESFYSPPQLIDAMWRGLERAGFDYSAKVLDAGCGSGAFFAGAPSKVQSHSTLVGIDSDPIAVRLARAVAPDATFINGKYEQAVLANNFDLVVGNVPFGSSKVHDSRYGDVYHVHDYFIIRSLDQLKAGGLMAVITSSGTLDKSDQKVREEIFSRANLVSAIRLPQQAFSHLGASVDTDILFLQKRPPGTLPDADYSEVARVTLDLDSGELVEDPHSSDTVNRYFLQNPENVLGQYVMASSAFGPKLSLIDDTLDKQQTYNRLEALRVMVNQRIEATVPEGIGYRSEWEKASSTESVAVQADDWGDNPLIPYQEGRFVGDHILDADNKLVEIVDVVPSFDGQGVINGYDHIVAESKLKGKRLGVMLDYIPLRDACRALIDAQVSGTDAELAHQQSVTKAAYQAFVDIHGPVNTGSNLRVYGDDAGSAEVCALEIWDDDKDEILTLSDTFTKRVVGGATPAAIESAEDAYFHSIDMRGRVDFEFMSEASGRSVDELKGQLVGSLVFFNPVTEEYDPHNQYLSGNVVKKLREAEQAVLTMPELQVNVEKLLEAQPDPIPFEDISFKLGVGWIPAPDIEAFVSSLFDREFSPRDLSVTYLPELGSWTVEVSNAFKSDLVTQRTALHGTKDCAFEKLLEMQLNAQRPTHYDDDLEGRKVVSDERTLASRSKQDDLEGAFRSWITRDEDRMLRYANLYNENCNAIALPKIDGSRLTFPGLSPTWKPRAHQKDAVALGMMGNSMAAHCVGAGKTFEEIALAMKLKQIGVCNKPAIVVPNNLLGQMTRDAKQMYPGARILQIMGEDLRGNARQRFLARVRNNDWDLVIFTHSMMNRIQAPLNIQISEYRKRIDLLESKVATAAGRAKRQLEAELKTQRSKLANVIKDFEDAERKGDVLTMDRLGIDSLNVDEWHYYKNLTIASNMDVLGVTRGGSQRASNLDMLGHYLRSVHGRSVGLNGFTGTPLANTMCELYVHMKILRPEYLEESGIYNFDEWAKRFGEVVTALEPLPEGGGFKVNERFAKFVNLPEMIKLFRTFADVKNPSDLNLPVPKVNVEVVAVDQTDAQKDFMKHLAIRATQVRNGSVKPHQDNMLSISTAGRKAALDLRLVSEILPADSSIKLEHVKANVLQRWEQHADVKGTQLVFMDLGTPKKDGSFSTYEDLKRQLVEAGVPANQIAFIHDAKNDAEKMAIYDQVNRGDIRVLIGSTEKMGAGMNVQERLCALHHVDCPWRPNDIEQRNGRIRRQGNKFFEEVEEFRYTTKDSFDLFMWGGNQRKATFIAKALGDPTTAGREVSEDLDMGYAEVMAVTTGNPKIREKVEVDDRVNKMERRLRAWQSDLFSKVSAARNLRDQIASVSRTAAAMQKAHAALPKTPIKFVELQGAVSRHHLEGACSLLRATETGEALLMRSTVAHARLMKHNSGYEKLGMAIGGIELVLTMDLLREPFVQGLLDGDLLPQKWRLSKSPQSMGASVREFYDASYHANKLNAEVSRLEGQLELVKDASLQQDWPRQGELDQLKATQKELDLWFAKQDFNSLMESDPFIERLERIREEMRAEMQLASLELEIAKNGDTALLAHGFENEPAIEDLLSSEPVAPSQHSPSLRMG